MVGTDILEPLVGKTIKQILWNDEWLQFNTDRGLYLFGVDADCCSESYFFDFYGVKWLLMGSPIVETRAVELHPTVELTGPQEEVQVYGYAMTTIHPVWGAVTSIFSFRNASNGYYGGSLELVLAPDHTPSPGSRYMARPGALEPLTEDCTGREGPE